MKVGYEVKIMRNKNKSFILLILTLAIIIGSICLIIPETNSMTNEEIAESLLTKIHTVSIKSIKDYKKNIETENSIQKYEERIKKEYKKYFTEKGMILSIANRDTEWLLQAASSYNFTTSVKSITLNLREENTNKKVYDYELMLLVKLESDESIEKEYAGYIEFSSKNDVWLIDRCRIDQDLKSILK